MKIPATIRTLFVLNLMVTLLVAQASVTIKRSQTNVPQGRLPPRLFRSMTIPISWIMDPGSSIIPRDPDDNYHPLSREPLYPRLKNRSQSPYRPMPWSLENPQDHLGMKNPMRPGSLMRNRMMHHRMNDQGSPDVSNSELISGITSAVESSLANADRELTAMELAKQRRDRLKESNSFQCYLNPVSCF